MEGELTSSMASVPITLNDLLVKSGCDLDMVRVMRHQDDDPHRTQTIYELWRDKRAEFERYQSQQDARTHAIVKDSAQWASFVATPRGETMFVGLYNVRYIGVSETNVVSPVNGDVSLAGSIYLYEAVKNSSLADYEGLLFIAWGTHPSAYRAWCQHAVRRDKPIIELRKKVFEPEFPGYLKIIEKVTNVPTLPLSWIEALKSAQGIYVLTCPRSQELYVGSATGSEGFYGRWCEYARNGHGGNIKLRKRDRSEYQVSILEVAGSSLSTQDIQGLESHWKNKLQTRAMGLNSN